MTCAVISIKIDSVNKFAISITAIIAERDYKSKYLFRMYSVATNLVTSLEFRPIHCATMLCHFGRTRNGYVVTRFFLLSRTAESSAKSGYMVVPERFIQNGEPVSRNEEPKGKNPVLFPAVDLIDAICKHM